MLKKLKKDKRVRFFFLCVFFWSDVELFFLGLGVPSMVIYVVIFPFLLLIFGSLFKITGGESITQNAYTDLIKTMKGFEGTSDNSVSSSKMNINTKINQSSQISMNAENVVSGYLGGKQTVTGKKVNPYSIGGK